MRKNVTIEVQSPEEIVEIEDLGRELGINFPFGKPNYSAPYILAHVGPNPFFSCCWKNPLLGAAVKWNREEFIALWVAHKMRGSAST